MRQQMRLTDNSEHNIRDRGFDMMGERTATLGNAPGNDCAPSTGAGPTCIGRRNGIFISVTNSDL
jgi:hypothetical protein